MASTKFHRSINKEEWERRLDEVKIPKEELNKLIMDYFVIEGFKEAAEKFSQESGTKSEVDLNTINDRMEIRDAIKNGNIEEAIKRTNSISEKILPSNPSVLFHLELQQLVELLKKGNIVEALSYAQKELASLTESNTDFLDELERTMSLFAFENLSISDNPVKDLLNLEQRTKTATELNAAILTSQNQEKEPLLPTLIKMLKWCQALTMEKIKYPKINNFVTASFEYPPTSTPTSSSTSASSSTNLSSSNESLRSSSSSSASSLSSQAFRTVASTLSSVTALSMALSHFHQQAQLHSQPSSQSMETLEGEEDEEQEENTQMET